MKHNALQTRFYRSFLLGFFLIALTTLPLNLPAQETHPEKAPPCTLVNRLRILGNDHFSGARLKLRLKTLSTALLPGRMGCLNPDWIKKDVRNLTLFYYGKGFASAVVTADVIPDPDEGKGHILNFHVDEGPRYELRFSGNRFFSDRKLKKAFTLFEKGDRGGSGLKKERLNITKRYQEAGFQAVKVALDVQVVDSDSGAVKQATFSIEENDRKVVEALEITGNDHIETDKILDAMLLRPKGLLEAGGFNTRTLKKDLEAINLVCLSHGFLSAEVSHTLREERVVSDDEDDPDSTGVYQVFLTIHIKEGPRTRVTTADIQGLEGIIDKEDALASVTLTPGTPFRDYMVKSDANLLAAMVSEKGYPHVKVEGTTHLNPDKTQADITWKVTPGPFTRFGGIRYTGNDRLKEKVIEKKVSITPGEPFSLQQLFRTQKKIREISSVETVKITAHGLKEKAHAPDLEIAVTEKKPYYVEATLGFDTENLGYLRLKSGDTNFMGRDMHAWAEGYISGIGHRFETGITDPFFLDTYISAGFLLFHEEENPLNQDFGVRTWGAESRFSRRLTPHLKAGLNFKYENRLQLDGDDAAEQDNRNILISTASLAWDNRDSVLKPTKGFLSFASVDLFTGFDNDLDRFVKYQWDLRHYRAPFKGLVLAAAGRAGYIQPMGSADTVAEDQLFFLGGISDVRGFKENLFLFDDADDPLGGRLSLSGSLEARIDLPANLELTFFLDAGKLEDLQVTDVDTTVRYAVGTGLRYITPIGPVGILYGHKLDPEPGESSGRFHISVGYTF